MKAKLMEWEELVWFKSKEKNLQISTPEELIHERNPWGFWENVKRINNLL